MVCGPGDTVHVASVSIDQKHHRFASRFRFVPLANEESGLVLAFGFGIEFPDSATPDAGDLGFRVIGENLLRGFAQAITW